MDTADAELCKSSESSPCFEFKEIMLYFRVICVQVEGSDITRCQAPPPTFAVNGFFWDGVCRGYQVPCNATATSEAYAALTEGCPANVSSSSSQTVAGPGTSATAAANAFASGGFRKLF